MEFHHLLQLVEEPKLLEHIARLLKKKAQAKEKDKIAPIPQLQEFIDSQYERNKEIARQFKPSKQGAEPLDSFFRNMLRQVVVK